MPYEDEFLSVLPRKTRKEYEETYAHSYNLLRSRERLRGTALGAFVPTLAAQPFNPDTEGARLVITTERLLVLALPWTELGPAELIAEAPLEPAGRIFLPTTVREQEEPFAQTLRIRVSGGFFEYRVGYWFHFLSN